MININIENITPLTIEIIRPIIEEKYDKKTFLLGTSGLIRFMEEMMVEDIEKLAERKIKKAGLKYACTNTSRSKFFRLNYENDRKFWESDPGGVFIHIILDAMKDIVEEHSRDFIDNDLLN